jgi:hypothetical protein
VAIHVESALGRNHQFIPGSAAMRQHGHESSTGGPCQFIQAWDIVLLGLVVPEENEQRIFGKYQFNRRVVAVLPDVIRYNYLPPGPP